MLNKQDKYHKEYLALTRRQDEIYKEKYSLPKIECIPYQSGWNVTISLREDILNRDDADFILELIKIGYHEKNHITSVKEVRLIRQGIYEYTRKAWNGDKVCVDLKPRLKRLSEKQYETLTERQKPYFIKYTDVNYQNYGYRESNNVYYQLVIPHYWIKLKAKAHMITQMRDISPELEAEYDYIRKQLDKPQYRDKYYRRNYRRYEYKSERERAYLKEETQKEINNYLTNGE